MDALKVLCQNYKGTFDPRVINCVQDLMRRLILNFVCLIKAHVDEEKAHSFCTKEKKKIQRDRNRQESLQNGFLTYPSNWFPCW